MIASRSSRETISSIGTRSTIGRDVDALDDAVQVDPGDERVDVQTGDHPVEIEPVDHAVELDAFGDELVEVDLVERRVDDLGDEQPQERRRRLLVARALLAPALVEPTEPVPRLTQRLLHEPGARQEREEELGAAHHRGGGAGAPLRALERDPDRRARDERDTGGRAGGLVARRLALGERLAAERAGDGLGEHLGGERRHPDRDPERLLDQLLERRRGLRGDPEGDDLAEAFG